MTKIKCYRCHEWKPIGGWEISIGRYFCKECFIKFHQATHLAASAGIDIPEFESLEPDEVPHG